GRAAAAGARGRQSEGTRELIMATAERLFAEHGLAGVSARQISEAAGQGNNAAVGYHFGTKTDLIRAIVRRHNQLIELRRVGMLERLGADAGPRDWIECLVRPLTEHLAEPGGPSWYARFSLQVGIDPVLREILSREVRSAPGMVRVAAGLRPSLAALPPEVRRARLEMIRHLIEHTCADRERALATATRPVRADWDRAARLLVDAVAGLLLAPVTPAR
ncbi:TetR family transcriptional regulator, partial [Actinospica durhamensis]